MRERSVTSPGVRLGGVFAFARVRPIAVVLVLLLVLLELPTVRSRAGHDYLPIYAAARLLVSGRNAYDLDALRQVEQPITASASGLFRESDFIAYYYPPWLALACVPLSELSFDVSKDLWVFLAYLSLIVAGCGLTRLPGLRLQMIVVLGFVIPPPLLGAHLGQTTALLLMLVVAVWRLLERRLDGCAGCVLALTTFKPQMSVLVVSALLIWSARQSRWRVVAGFALMLGAMGTVCTALMPSWPRDMLTAPRLSPLPTMTNPSDGVTWVSVLRSLGVTGWPMLLAYAAVALPTTALALCDAWNRVRASSDIIATSIVGAFFVAPHSLAYDFTMLVFPIVALASTFSEQAATRFLTVVVLAVNLHFSLVFRGTAGLSFVTLFWLPAALAIVRIRPPAATWRVRSLRNEAVTTAG